MGCVTHILQSTQCFRGLTHTGRKYRKCPIGKTSSNVIVIPELIYCLGGHESKELIMCVSMCVLQVNMQLPMYVGKKAKGTFVNGA